ncbi:glycerol-3-phosphate acyltransferase [Lysinibacillus sp. 54212]|uniref:glycerol-3-phosphate acyltransferase n=1 Tax=Lysinibacillus sp. 54212 TaxID=3119829 RepID=UPI002FC7CA2C
MEIFIYLLVSYLIGNFMTASFVGKLYGVSLQDENSGNLGARNAGRTLGKLAFMLTLLGDAFKGALVVIIGNSLDFSSFLITLGILFVILGHLYPFWLRFKGGMGIATMIGSFLAFSPTFMLAMIAGTALFLIFTRSLTLSMIGGFMAYSFAILFSGNFHWSLLIGVLVLLTYEHRDNLMKRVR